MIKGATRWVILTKKYAWKFPSFHSWKLFLCGLLSNMSEVVWNRIQHPSLCPIQWSVWGGFLNVMPRIETLPNYLSLEEYNRLFVDTKDYTDYTLKFVENKPHHFGYYGGRGFLSGSFGNAT